jgi:hypothetical protein
MIGSYSWSFSNSGASTAASGDTYCSSCTVNVSDVAIANSVAASNTSGNNNVGCVLRVAVFALMIVFLYCNGCCTDLLAQLEQYQAEECLYEQCSAASDLRERLTLAAQVYGGSLSLGIGAYVWSQSPQQASSASTCSAGVTVVSGLWTELNNIRISGSHAGAYTIGGNGGAL